MSALIFPEPRPAMAANVVKAADHRSLIPYDDQTFTGDFRDEIITGSCDLILVPDQNPMLGKNLPLFLRKNLRGDKIALCQAPCASCERLSRFAKCRCYAGLCRWHLRMLHAAYVRVNALIAPLVVRRLNYRFL